MSQPIIAPNYDTVSFVLALTWMDANEHRSVCENPGLRQALTERAIRQYVMVRDLRAKT